jgi:hypothetical protein
MNIANVLTGDNATKINAFYVDDQDTYTLYNDGPCSVYVGDDSSVNYTTGTLLPPLASMEWNQDQDVYAVCGLIAATTLNGITLFKQATLIQQPTTPNIHTPNNIPLHITKPLYTAAAGTLNDNGSRNLPIIEVGSFATIAISLEFFSLISLSIGSNMSYSITWYDENGDIVDVDIFYTWIPINGALQYIRTPVRAVFCRIRITNSTGTQLNFGLVTVSGSTASFRDAVSAPFANNVPVGSNTQSWKGTRVFAALDINWDYNDVYIMPPSNLVRIIWKYTTGVTGAGFFDVSDGVSSGISYGRMNAPIAAGGDRLAANFILPTGRPIVITNINPPTGGANPQLSLIFSDYN